jgi:hypothetical protein
MPFDDNAGLCSCRTLRIVSFKLVNALAESVIA